ncbi:MAG: hypothetical protein OER56_03215, partial [Hyphomicrobiales bacterium]|nr:hypothetical protein [Hyphomicrobiales bacterium]
IAAHRVRCDACPMHRIAPRTAPARMNRYDPMKWVAITGIWYKSKKILHEANPCRIVFFDCRRWAGIQRVSG